MNEIILVVFSAIMLAFYKFLDLLIKSYPLTDKSSYSRVNSLVILSIIASLFFGIAIFFLATAIVTNL